ncbi:ankyrin [Myriangium duriaei CBS 260.36]|uniref:Ankyrin n=1 Tax=Myriangium duriaei CBS 260.36 TaxID=1168546 RepID=A0A9P4JFJ5_9PEZI|nr:ankyrin [Myriangium duriaei CBS 260.36]
MSSPPLILDEDTVDDILYSVRVADISSLTDTLSTAAQSHSTTPSSILSSTTSPDGNTPLHYAAANGHSSLLTHLLSLYTQPVPTEFLDAKNEAGNTPLHWAALNGHLAAVKVLVSAGAGLWGRNNAGNLPVFEAERAEKGDVVAYLLVEGGKEEEQRRGETGEEVDGEEVGEEDVEGVRKGVEGAGI